MSSHYFILLAQDSASLFMILGSLGSSCDDFKWIYDNFANNYYSWWWSGSQTLLPLILWALFSIGLLAREYLQHRQMKAKGKEKNVHLDEEASRYAPFFFGLRVNHLPNGSQAKKALERKNLLGLMMPKSETKNDLWYGTHLDCRALPWKFVYFVKYRKKKDEWMLFSREWECLLLYRSCDLFGV